MRTPLLLLGLVVIGPLVVGIGALLWYTNEQQGTSQIGLSAAGPLILGFYAWLFALFDGFITFLVLITMTGRPVAMSIAAGAAPTLLLVGGLYSWGAWDTRKSERIYELWQSEGALLNEAQAIWQREGCTTPFPTGASIVTADAKGRVWIRSEGGLDLWDGFRLTQVVSATNLGLESWKNASIAPDGNGRIWFSNAPGLPILINDTPPFESVPLPNADQFPGQREQLGRLATDGGGQLAIELLNRKYLVVLADERWTTTPPLPNETSDALGIDILTMLFGRKGDLWVAFTDYPRTPHTSDRLAQLENGEWVDYGRLLGGPPKFIHFSRDSQVWIGGQGGIYSIVGRQLQDAASAFGIPSESYWRSVYAMSERPDQWWLAAQAGLIKRERDRTTTYPLALIKTFDAEVDAGRYGPGKPTGPTRDAPVSLAFDGRNQLLFTDRNGTVIVCPHGTGPNK